MSLGPAKRIVLKDIKVVGIGCGVMSTPGLVIDDAVIHASGVPPRSNVESWL